MKKLLVIAILALLSIPVIAVDVSQELDWASRGSDQLRSAMRTATYLHQGLQERATYYSLNPDTRADAGDISSMKTEIKTKIGKALHALCKIARKHGWIGEMLTIVESYQEE